MRIAPLLVLGLGCSHPQAAEPPSSKVAEPLAPATPAPRVAWTDNRFAITGLPAVASDGSVVVVAHTESDDGRGNPNLTLITRDRNDRVVAQLVVLSANDEATNAAGRVATAQTWLDEQHRKTPLVPLAQLGKTEGDKRDTITAGKTTVRWATNQLAITEGGSPLASRATPPAWLAPDHAMCTGCAELCHNPAFLDTAYVDTARKTALVVVNYEGSDTCWEPGAQEHVIAW